MTAQECYEQVMETLREMEALAASQNLEHLSRKVSSALRVADREFVQRPFGSEVRDVA